MPVVEVAVAVVAVDAWIRQGGQLTVMPLQQLHYETQQRKIGDTLAMPMLCVSSSLMWHHCPRHRREPEQQRLASTAVVPLRQAHSLPLAEPQLQARRRLHPAVHQCTERQPRRRSLALRQPLLRLLMLSWWHY